MSFNDDEIAKTIALIGKKLDKNDNEFDAIGKNVAANLRNMTHYQQGIAEKLINEVIFLGRFEKLNLNTAVNIGPTQESQNVQMQTKCMPMHPISNSCIPATRNAQIISIPESDTFAPATQDSQVISIPESLVPYLNFT
ncbi:unnamed protein product [Colias eurytheme]|nr:unnamed protein product [Colias eurytheme]